MAVFDCTCTQMYSKCLRGDPVDFTGSHFEQLELNNAQLNL